MSQTAELELLTFRPFEIDGTQSSKIGMVQVELVLDLVGVQETDELYIRYYDSDSEVCLKVFSSASLQVVASEYPTNYVRMGLCDGVFDPDGNASIQWVLDGVLGEEKFLYNADD